MSKPAKEGRLCGILTSRTHKKLLLSDRRDLIQLSLKLMKLLSPDEAVSWAAL
jgi:hypothetical protein